ncbi:MAG: hypothetical protein IPP61_00855 [Cytophagaceae bacterium]|nr:hypothetical protein [Cytophagaceae bacterium]MBK9934470.1 hypothetical protein [Cytophagaceae bacterium]MBL0300917.1 hypothetical protein [Cytophagaceae bacterium]MBL0323731.1 hypothetical protein [Cytophagaceae bacterium]
MKTPLIFPNFAQININILPKISFFQNFFIALLAAIFLIYIIHISISLYIPLFFMVLFSFWFGLTAHKKGWVFTFLQLMIVIAGYWALVGLGLTAKMPDQAIFVSHISFFPILFPGLVVSLIYRF